jgi:hypothetical protein
MTPSYDLAKKLKDAGLPQWGPNHFYDKNGLRRGCFSEEDIEEGFVYAPSLSELIEACGKGIISLSRGAVSKDWLATNNVHAVSGSTPEEAVANLYLALHA